MALLSIWQGVGVINRGQARKLGGLSMKGGLVCAVQVFLRVLPLALQVSAAGWSGRFLQGVEVGWA